MSHNRDLFTPGNVIAVLGGMTINVDNNNTDEQLRDAARRAVRWASAVLTAVDELCGAQENYRGYEL